MSERTEHIKRIQRLESALLALAELPLFDAFGEPIADIRVEYRGGSGWSMRFANKRDPHRVIVNARKLLGLKLSGPHAQAKESQR